MTATAYDEMRDGEGRVRSHYREFDAWLAGMPANRLAQKRAEADSLFRRTGITFAVYGEEAGAERLIPFDVVPRIITAAEWHVITS